MTRRLNTSFYTDLTCNDGAPIGTIIAVNSPVVIGALRFAVDGTRFTTDGGAAAELSWSNVSSYTTKIANFVGSRPASCGVGQPGLRRENGLSTVAAVPVPAAGTDGGGGGGGGGGNNGPLVAPLVSPPGQGGNFGIDGTAISTAGMPGGSYWNGAIHTANNPSSAGNFTAAGGAAGTGAAGGAGVNGGAGGDGSVTLTDPAVGVVFTQSSPGRYTYVVPGAVATLDYVLNGAGGGGGGADGGNAGGSGGIGARIQGTINVAPGQTLIIYVGGGGGGGLSNSSNTNSGGSPSSTINILNGGIGGAAGRGGFSGGGGAGGGASMIMRGTTIIAIAAGGGGGGGGTNGIGVPVAPVPSNTAQLLSNVLDSTNIFERNNSATFDIFQSAAGNYRVKIRDTGYGYRNGDAIIILNSLLPGSNANVIVQAVNVTDDPEDTMGNVTASKYPGYLYCNGQEVLVKDYPELYKVLGIHYGGTADPLVQVPDTALTLYGSNPVDGAGNPVTFRLPDYRAKRLVGSGGVWGNGSLTLTPLAHSSPLVAASAEQPGSYGGRLYIDSIFQQEQTTIGNPVTTGYGDVQADVGGTLSGEADLTVGPISPSGISQAPTHDHDVYTAEVRITNEIYTDAATLSECESFDAIDTASIISFTPPRTLLSHGHALVVDATGGSTLSSSAAPAGQATFGDHDAETTNEIGTCASNREIVLRTYTFGSSIFVPFGGDPTNAYQSFAINALQPGAVGVELYTQQVGPAPVGDSADTTWNPNEISGFVIPSNCGNRYMSFGTFDNSVENNRSAAILVNATDATEIAFIAIAGNDRNGGERPNDPNESLEFRLNNGGAQTAWEILIPSNQRSIANNWTVAPPAGAGPNTSEYDVVFGVWRKYQFDVPAAYRVNNLRVEFRQEASAPEFSSYPNYDQSQFDGASDAYGIAKVELIGNHPNTSYRPATPGSEDRPVACALSSQYLDAGLAPTTIDTKYAVTRPTSTASIPKAAVDTVTLNITIAQSGISVNQGEFTMTATVPIDAANLNVTLRPEVNIPLSYKYNRVKYLIKAYSS